MSKKPKFSCILCDKKIKFDEKLKTIIGAVDLIAYAHSGSKHDFTNVSYTDKQIHLCMCDDCYEKVVKKKGNKFNVMVRQIRGY